MPSRSPIVPQFLAASDQSVLVKFGEDISMDHHQRVLNLSRLLLTHPTKSIRNIHPAYSSVLISFDPSQTNHTEITGHVHRLLEGTSSADMNQSRTVEIPVCYDNEFGPDLNDVANHCGLTKDKVIDIHRRGDYRVYFLGFSPGFPYLGGLSDRIITPRLSTPRTRVPAGSVAIGGNQAGIYPIESPGGWRIIGRTPVKLFDPEKNPPTLLEMGNVVRFRAITKEEYEEILQGIEKK